MSKHDTWVHLIPNSPYKSIEHLFPEGFPMRDPFPMEIAQNTENEIVSLWIVDLSRLNDEQREAFATVLAEEFNVSAQLVLEEAKREGGFAMNHAWIDSMWGGAETIGVQLSFWIPRLEEKNGKNAQAWEKLLPAAIKLTG